MDSVIGFQSQHNNTRGPFKGGIKDAMSMDIDSRGLLRL